MNLYCSDCGCYFDSQETIFKEELMDITVPYRYYHKQCLPKGAKVIDKGNLKHFTDIIDGKYKADIITPLCESCHKPLDKRSNAQKNCYKCSRKIRKEYDRKYKVLARKQLLLSI